MNIKIKGYKHHKRRVESKRLFEDSKKSPLTHSLQIEETQPVHRKSKIAETIA